MNFLLLCNEGLEVILKHSTNHCLMHAERVKAMGIEFTGTRKELLAVEYKGLAFRFIYSWQKIVDLLDSLCHKMECLVFI